MVAGHYKLAMVYLNGDGVERDYQQAFKWFTQAANLGHPESQYNLGWMYSSGAGVQNFPWRQSGTLKQLNKELLLLNLTLGELIIMARALPKTLNKPLVGIRLPPIRGMLWHKTTWVFSTTVERVPVDYLKAIKWYNHSAQQGLADAQNNLAIMFAFGKGVPQDYVKAYAWVISPKPME